MSRPCLDTRSKQAFLGTILLVCANSKAVIQCDAKSFQIRTLRGLEQGSYRTIVDIQFERACRDFSFSYSRNYKSLELKLENLSLGNLSIRDSLSKLPPTDTVFLKVDSSSTRIAWSFISPVIPFTQRIGDSGLTLSINWAESIALEDSIDADISIPVSFFSLLGNESVYHNKRIAVVGYFHGSFEESLLCFEKNSSKAIKVNCIMVSSSRVGIKKFNREKVYMEGVYSMLGSGRNFIHGTLFDLDTVFTVK